MEEWKEWFDEFCRKSGTSYNKSRSDKRGSGVKVVVSGWRKCIHNVKYKKTKVAFTEDEGTEKKGPGRKKGQDRVPHRNTDCEAVLEFQLAGTKLHQSKSSAATKGEDVKNYPMEIKLHYKHNHSINCADALRFRDVGDEAKRRLLYWNSSLKETVHPQLTKLTRMSCP